MAKKPSGEGIDTWLTFPLYFDFDWCESFFSTYCSRDADDISIELVEYLQKLTGFNIEFGTEFQITQSDLEKYGIEIYFKGLKCNSISKSEFDSIAVLNLDGKYEFETIFGIEYCSYVLLRGSGEIYFEL